MRGSRAPRIVTLAIITTVTVVSWVFFEVYRVFTTTPSVDVPQELLRPIDPSLDASSLQKIENRIFFKEDEIPEILVPTATPELPAPTPTSVEVEVTEETPTPTATPSAETE